MSGGSAAVGMMMMMMMRTRRDDWGPPLQGCRCGSLGSSQSQSQQQQQQQLIGDYASSSSSLSPFVCGSRRYSEG